jgi:hypothetical protein
MQEKITPVVGGQYDYDPRHYRFERSAGPLHVPARYSFVRDTLPLLLCGALLVNLVLIVINVVLIFRL